MKAERRKIETLFLVVAASILIVTGWITALSAAETTPLRILLTNDDGYDAPGIKAVHEILVAAGHDVTLVAPLNNQSGSGVRVTSRGTLDYKEQSTGVWSVDGSPADSVLVGLLHTMRDESPDIVISGANFGPNLGYGSSSGTVGAATMAMYRGVPAIAISVGVDPSESNTQPTPFPSTHKAFAGAAQFTLMLIDKLQKGRVDNGDLLPEHTILNVNYPAADTEEIAGVRLVRAARGSRFRLDYEGTERADRLKVQLRFIEPDKTESDDTDVQLFSHTYVTISVLDGDWDAGQPLRETVSRRLSTIDQW